jgi:DMSO/TMAO reductase YedYZ molybdopterin-dependent catalytic subunit
MTERFVTRGFVGRRREAGTDGDVASRVPPGQYLTSDFPVLTAGPTPSIPLDRWSFSIDGLVKEPMHLVVG